MDPGTRMVRAADQESGVPALLTGPLAGDRTDAPPSGTGNAPDC